MLLYFIWNVKMVLGLNYKIVMQSDLTFSTPVSNSCATIELSTESTDFFNYCLREIITKIWNAFIDSFLSFYSQVQPFSYGLITYPEVNEDLSQKALEKIYWGLGKEDKWRECIDGTHHYLDDKYCFDTGAHGGAVEPGFISSMEETFTFVQKFLNVKVDADWYLLLHKHTTAHFKGADTRTLMGHEKAGVFRNTYSFITCFMAKEYAITPEAMAEFRDLDQELQNEFGPDYGLGEMNYVDGHQIVQIDYKDMSSDKVRRIFNKFLGDYYTEIEIDKTPDEKLWAVAKLQQRLEWLHAVKDGTSRTDTAMMNKFLTEVGFHPAILEYPHVSTSYGLRQWKQYLQEGLIKWEQERDRLRDSL